MLNRATAVSREVRKRRRRGGEPFTLRVSFYFIFLSRLFSPVCWALNPWPFPFDPFSCIFAQPSCLIHEHVQRRETETRGYRQLNGQLIDNGPFEFAAVNMSFAFRGFALSPKWSYCDLFSATANRLLCREFRPVAVYIP